MGIAWVVDNNAVGFGDYATFSFTHRADKMEMVDNLLAQE